MSILNAWVGGDRAWVAVDTEGVHHGDGATFECQKMVPLVHQAAILASRGTAVFLPAVFFNVATCLFNFDDLVQQMPVILRHAFDESCRSAEAAGIEIAKDFDKEVIVLVGWSNWHQQMVAIEYIQHDRSIGFAAQTVGPAYYSPWIEGMQAPPFADPFDRTAMVRLAKMQVGLIEDRTPGAAGGGRYIVAELGRQRMTIETVCEDLGRRHR